jgi:surface antigen
MELWRAARVVPAPHSREIVNQISVRPFCPSRRLWAKYLLWRIIMRIGIALMAAAAALCVTALAASAQNYGPPRDPDNYYSQSDQRGYYDHNGRYRRMREQYDQRSDYRDDQRAPAAYYRQGEYEQSCHRGNAAAGTIFGAVAGGLVGSAVSRGNGGAVVGGAVLGGLLGNTISRDIDCDDQPYAFRTYSDGLNGDVGRRYDWNHGEARGYFQPTREYQRSGIQCRDFTETTYRGGREVTHSGTACRASDGQWRFD